ncbi:ABC transporter permease [Falsibacillus pallidus]|uniref:ABC transporter permease n=1 Tax=Falsibacillus pallidus TaxID=493781 RepID=UPI003D9612DF
MLLYKYGFTNINYKAIYSFQSVKLFILFRLIDPIIHYLFYAALVSSVIGSEFIKFVVIGNIAFYTFQTMSINFLNMFRMERRFGTLELSIASPTSTLLIILRKAIVPFLDSSFVFAAGLVIGHFLFGLEMPLMKAGTLFVLMVITLFSMMSFSMIFAAVSLLVENPNLYLNIVLAVTQILCGANFAVHFLPGPLESIARMLPLTNSIEALRGIFGLESYAIAPLLMKEFSIGIGYLLISLILIAFMERAARRNGALFKSV